MLGTFFVKLIVSMLAAAGLYWMRIPHAVVILMMMQTLDLVTGVLVSVLKGDFKIRRLGEGVLLKAVAYPMLAACDLAEEPLHLAFHLDAYVALALVSYEFLSIVENYARVRPLPKVLQVAAQKAHEWLSAGDFTVKTVENVVERVELVPGTRAPAVITTTTKETHTEPITPND